MEIHHTRIEHCSESIGMILELYAAADLAREDRTYMLSSGMGNHVCPWWLAFTFDNPLRRLVHKPEKIFTPYLLEGMTAIDIGCGMGYFSVAMADMVGEKGKIISVDVQKKMLDFLIRRAEKAGVASRITTHVCNENEIGIQDEVDFALAFWMAHETPDVRNLLNQVRSILKGSGKFLIAEPKFHVTKGEFHKTLSTALEMGYRQIASPEIFFSHAVVLEK